jgi:hypothetical protein
MSGIAAGHLIANVLDGRIAAETAADVYQHWVSEWVCPGGHASFDILSAARDCRLRLTGRGDPKKERDSMPSPIAWSREIGYRRVWSDKVGQVR